MTNNPIYCAIDTSDTEQAIALIEKIRPFIGGVKLGLEFYTHCGIEGINKIKELGLPMFIDLKLFDIPNTTKSALQGILASEPELTTLHISGGSEMLRDCVDIRDSNKSKTKLIGVTVLTSFSNSSIKRIGHTKSIKNLVKEQASLAKLAKLDGIVCSGFEAKFLKTVCKNMEIVTPGIRLTGDLKDDQKRIMTPKNAFKNGATAIVMGRSVTNGNIKNNIKKLIKSLI